MASAHVRPMEMPRLVFPQSLTERYQPHQVGQFAGLARPKAVLGELVKRPYASVWLFLGPSGVGKTTMALAIATSIRAELQHIPSRKCDLESVEAACRRCHFMPLFTGGMHLVLVDEADQMTQAAQLALLSKLDATAFPPNTIFIFTANDTRLLEPRFLSRCRVLEFNTQGMQQDLPALLERISRREGQSRPLAFSRLAQQAGYNVRDALMKLEVELLAGGVDSEPAPSQHEHTHHCPKCSADWLHEAEDCDLRYRAQCRNCGGARTIGQERAEKAVATRRRNLDRMLRDARKGQRRKREAA